MDEDTFNLEVRKLLKTFGVSAQREIEKAVDEAIDAGRLDGEETLSASIRLEVPAVDLDVTTEGTIELS